MSEPFLAEIRVFSFQFAPRGWFACEGQLLPISQYTALFSLIGTFYGGDGRSTFGLPDFRGRTPIHQGNNFVVGQQGGTETVTLQLSNLPTHTHALNASSGEAIFQNPGNAILAQPDRSGPAIYETSAPPSENMAGAAIGPIGSGQPFSTHQPSVVLNFCIAYQGIFPARN